MTTMMMMMKEFDDAKATMVMILMFLVAR